MDADAVAERLYRVPPGEFVAERDDAAARAREAGDSGAAREIAALRRPTRAAWLTNLLVDAAPDEVEGLLALAGPLAEAQRSLDGPALRQVSAQRNKLVGALARRAARLGRDAGQRVDSGLEREVRGVLESALADDELAERVRSGRLVRFERHSGFGTIGGDQDGPASGRGSRATTGATARGSATGTGRESAAPDAAGQDPRGQGTRRQDTPGQKTRGQETRGQETAGPGSAAEPGDDADRPGSGELDRKRREATRRSREQRAAERREREREAAEQRERERRAQALADAEDRLEQARLAAHDAGRERDDARERADAAADDRDAAHRRVEDLRAELEQARTEATGADRTYKAAEREAADAARRARQADTEVTRAEQALDEARDS